MAKIIGRTVTTPPPKKISKYENDKKYVTEEKLTEELSKVGGGSVSEEDVRNAIESYMTENPIDLSNYYTKTEVDNLFNSITDGNEVAY